MTDSTLSLASLEERVGAYVESNASPKSSRFGRWTVGVGLLAGGAGFVVSSVIDGWLSSVFAIGGLIFEIAALVALLPSAVDVVDGFRGRHQKYAVELDHDYVGYRHIVDWLNTFSAREIARQQRYLRDRKASMLYRFGLFAGGMERLGVLPVIVVLYVQFKDWSFGDWHVLGQIHLLGALLLWALLLAFVTAWSVVPVKSRLDLYDALLTEALASVDVVVPKQTPI